MPKTCPLIVQSVVLAAALLAAGCDRDEPKPAPAADRAAEARKAAENSIRAGARDPDSVSFRGVQVWPQAVEGTHAVCGQVNVFGASSTTYALFVAAVTRSASAQDPARAYKVEARVGSTPSEATRAYIDTIARCFEGGGPREVARQGAPSIPPLPDDMARVQQQVAALSQKPSAPAAASPPSPVPPRQASPPSAPPPPAVTAAQGTVVMRQNGNVRIAPHGEAVRVEQQGTELRVFGEAPGGWLQVGNAAPIGWVHSSMVQRR